MTAHTIDTTDDEARALAASVATPDTGPGPALVAVFATHQAAEAAVLALGRAGVAWARLSIVGRDYHTEEQAAASTTWETASRCGERVACSGVG